MIIINRLDRERRGEACHEQEYSISNNHVSCESSSCAAIWESFIIYVKINEDDDDDESVWGRSIIIGLPLIAKWWGNIDTHTHDSLNCWQYFFKNSLSHDQGWSCLVLSRSSLPSASSCDMIGLIAMKRYIYTINLYIYIIYIFKHCRWITTVNNAHHQNYRRHQKYILSDIFFRYLWIFLYVLLDTNFSAHA